MASSKSSILPPYFPPSSSSISKSRTRTRLLLLLLLLASLLLLHRLHAFLNRPTLDAVYAHYDEDLGGLAWHMARVKKKLGWRFRIRNVVYVKGPEVQQGLHVGGWMDGRREVDRWERLENVGREGGTYLHHIITHYPPSPSSPNNTTALADKTLFLQAHMAWNWVGEGRFDFVGPQTGFLSLAPYVTGRCGKTEGHEYKQMLRIWEMFRGGKCPEDETQLVTWAGQFLVSRARILANPLSSYVELQRLLSAPADDPIHDETPWWYKSQRDPTDAFFGHSIERSWGVIFGCNNVTLAEERCGAREGPGGRDCQCFDSES